MLVSTGILFGVQHTQATGIRITQEDTTVYVVADEEPAFKGNMNEWIGQNISYPKAAQDSMIEGRVYISFIIEKDGAISHVTLARSVHPLLDAEALRVIGMMPKWKPAVLEGKNVRFSKTYPISFKLQQQQEEQAAEQVPQMTYAQYLENLAKESASIANKEGLTPEQQAERVVVLKQQLGDDATLYDLMIKKCQEIKQSIPALVKEQTPLLKLKKGDVKKLEEIYLNEIDSKIKLINGLGKDDFIRKFVAAELDMRKLELDKVLAIQSLLNKKFTLYFEKVVMKQ